LAALASGVINDPFATNGTYAHGINDSSLVVGDYAGHGFLYNGPKGTCTTLSDPSGSNATFAYGINNHNQFVGAYYSGGFHGFALLNIFAGYITLDDPFATNGTYAHGINDAGLIVGSYYTGPAEADVHGLSHGYLDTNGNFTTIDDPLRGPGGHTDAVGINNAGQIVGDYQDSSGNYHGYFYNNGTYTTLNAPGAEDTFATAINNYGDIVGSYRDLGHMLHGFLYSGGLYTTSVEVPRNRTQSLSGNRAKKAGKERTDRDRLRGWACRTRTQKRRRQLSL
jgi:probable HAF family extracellular repeat protein